MSVKWWCERNNKARNKQEGEFLGAVMTPMASSLINAIIRKGQGGGFLPLFVYSFIMKVLAKGVIRAGRGCDNMDLIDNIFGSGPFFKQ